MNRYRHSIDEKGRLTVPSKFRGELSVGLVVTRGLDRNLTLYPLASWQELYDNIMKQPLSDNDVRAFRRRVFSGATDLKPDKQGRVVLPQYLREFAGINGEVILTGMGNHLEIWHPSTWDKERDLIEDNEAVTRWDDIGI